MCESPASPLSQTAPAAEVVTARDETAGGGANSGRNASSCVTRPPMISIIQCNLNHCRVAQDLFMQYMPEQKVDVNLISDPYKSDP